MMILYTEFLNKYLITDCGFFSGSPDVVPIEGDVNIGSTSPPENKMRANIGNTFRKYV